VGEAVAIPPCYGYDVSRDAYIDTTYRVSMEPKTKAQTRAEINADLSRRALEAWHANFETVLVATKANSAARADAIQLLTTMIDLQIALNNIATPNGKGQRRQT